MGFAKQKTQDDQQQKTTISTATSRPCASA
jgi:hypothetical protein